jgi:phospholipid/cholesterol/gamma-HCH transport system substrate-binding protein
MASYSRGKDIARVGVTTIVSVCAFATLFGYSTNRSLTSDQSDLAIRFETADGLRKGDAVVYRGVQVGEVKKLEFDGAGAVIVHTTLTRPVPLTRGAGAELVAVDIFGRQSVVLTESAGMLAGGHRSRRAADHDTASLADGDTIIGGAAPTLTDRVEDLRGLAPRLIGDTTVQLLHGTLGGADTATRDLAELARTATGVLHGQRAALDSATAGAVTIIDNLAAVTDPAGFDRLRDNLTLATERMVAITARMDTSAVTAARVLGKIENGEGSAARMLNDPALYEAVLASVTSLDALLRDIRQNPKRYINVSVF